MKLEYAEGFVLRIGAKRIIAEWKGMTPGREIVFKLPVAAKISGLVPGEITFSLEGDRYFAKGVFSLPEPDLAVFYPKGGIQTDRRACERFATDEITGYLRCARDSARDMPVSAYEISEQGARVSTYYTLKKARSYVLELDFDPLHFSFANLKSGRILFLCVCEMVNMQIDSRGAAFYGIKFTTVTKENRKLLALFLAGCADLAAGGPVSAGVTAGAVRDAGYLYPRRAEKKGPEKTEAPVVSVLPEKEHLSQGTGQGSASHPLVPVQEKKGLPFKIRELAESSADGFCVFLRDVAALLKRVAAISAIAMSLAGIFYGLLLYWEYRVKQQIRVASVTPVDVGEAGIAMGTLGEVVAVEEEEMRGPEWEAVVSQAARIDVKPFELSLKPHEVTHANIRGVIRDNGFPVYNMSGTDYVSIRTVLRVLGYDGLYSEGMQSVTLQYGGKRLVILPHDSKAVIGGYSYKMVHPTRQVMGECLICLDEVERLLQYSSN